MRGTRREAIAERHLCREPRALGPDQRSPKDARGAAGTRGAAATTSIAPGTEDFRRNCRRRWERTRGAANNKQSEATWRRRVRDTRLLPRGGEASTQKRLRVVSSGQELGAFCGNGGGAMGDGVGNGA